ncbi:E3 ubiquitin-protein ligase complex slx8-rfp subunit slx8 [Wickerhamiella sorbophila]|uniref:RING-type E3 ubiquitin transferase n=1 Tax=Wickerhamiella sorbophila TaxID=45607 RepID=A0A2T0FMC0_9ASCO|nr:E3 ubiquitin-protein ligase complex slx8-rfp subunit slx8 [Wickerhamiella sorbophila]PRT56125.1 E3 ubiquitin-protein ligase complex slx8-rfp subunit slx8 [Wickerhamiella sorbophila]
MHDADSFMEAKRKSPDDDILEIVDIADDEQPASAPLVNFKCPICMDTPDVLVVTECGHLYCENCVFHALRSARNSTKTSGQCSICRKTVKYSNVKYLEIRLAGQGSVKWKDKRPKNKREKKTDPDGRKNLSEEASTAQPESKQADPEVTEPGADRTESPEKRP